MVIKLFTNDAYSYYHSNNLRTTYDLRLQPQTFDILTATLRPTKHLHEIQLLIHRIHHGLRVRVIVIVSLVVEHVRNNSRGDRVAGMEHAHTSIDRKADIR